MGDVLPSAGDTSPVLFALGAIFLSLVVLLGYGRAMDVRAGRLHGRSAHFYIAPAMFALAILTFYPVLYGIWLAFTDADATRLGDQAFIGLANFIEVFTASGFLRVTLFTLVWTVVNVAAHIGLGLFLAMVLQYANIRGKTAYRRFFFSVGDSSYISVLVGRACSNPKVWSTPSWGPIFTSSPSQRVPKSLSFS